MIKWVYVPDKTNHSIMLEYKIITSYYYDGMGNKVITLTKVVVRLKVMVGLILHLHLRRNELLILKVGDN
jgi:hypothetical protein